MDRLEGKVAVVTGAAGSIGAATVRLFVAQGARVVATDIEESGLAALAGDLGDAVVTQPADVTDSGQMRDIVALATDRFGKLDVAFANAGAFGVVSPIADYPEDVWDQVMAVNVRGPFLLLKHALPVISDGGSVILTSSVVGLTSDQAIGAYATSKHALVGLMRTAAKEMAARGVRVNTIHPGPVANDFQDRIEVMATGQDVAGANEIFNTMIPLGRHARAEEVAEAVLYLASDASAFMTGAAVPLDGGLSV